MRYGMPYQGSKNAIAEEIIGFLPKGDRLCDLFGGGGAISDCALMSCKYKRVLYNEFNPQVAKAFKLCSSGKLNIKDSPEYFNWYSREDFFRLKDSDQIIALCFSFGNGQRKYAYAKEIEPYKKACHMAIVFDDWVEMEYLCPEVVDEAKKALHGIENIYTRRRAFGPAIVRQLKKLNNIELVKGNPLYSSCHVKKDTKTRKKDVIRDLQSLQSLQSLESLQRLERLQSMERLEITIGSYENYQYQEGDVVYCDIPYQNTNAEYGNGFNHKQFYDWASSRPYEVYISSYQIDDDRFTEVWNAEKIISISSGSDKKGIERIYCNKADVKKRLMPVQGELF